MGKEVETKIKTTVAKAKGILHTIMEDSFKRVTTVIKIAVITSNYNPIPPISPTLIPSIQIIHTQFAKFAINQATQQSIITKGWTFHTKDTNPHRCYGRNLRWRWWPTKKVAEVLAVDCVHLGDGFVAKNVWFTEIY